ncbi:MAG: hypothetical protein KGZ81_13660 [Flavobacteriales bacterium]|nr:hypothetical protein [Flavobacteriales bacterium]
MNLSDKTKRSLLLSINNIVLFAMLFSSFLTPAMGLKGVKFQKRIFPSKYFVNRNTIDNLFDNKNIVNPYTANLNSKKNNNNFKNKVNVDFEYSISSDLETGIIGKNSEYLHDNPKDNVFRFNIQDFPEDKDLYPVIYFDVYGVKDKNSVSFNLNGTYNQNHISIHKLDEWSKQREVLNIDLFKKGLNYIIFSAENQDHFYKISNLYIKFEKLNDFVYIDSRSNHVINNQCHLKGFVKNEFIGSILKINQQEFEITSDYIDLSYKLNGETELELQLMNKKSKVIWFYNMHLKNIENKTYTERLKILQGTKQFNKINKDFFDFEDASLIINDSSLLENKVISIQKVQQHHTAPLGNSIVNVTKDKSVYRFLPDGTEFAKPSKIGLTYDKSLIPNGYTEKDIKTFYFDIKSKSWISVPKDTLDIQNSKLYSLTTHFTDYINGIIQVPESPNQNEFNPTIISGLQAATPTQGLTTISPPSASQTGEANVSYPIKIPSGRNGIQPSLTVNYNSDAGTSWLGEGWNLSMPSITVETKWGIPLFDENLETEVYNLNGEQLLHPKSSGSEYEYFPYRHEGELGSNDLTTNYQQRNNTGVTIFTLRNQGSFNKIERIGSSVESYYWKVTDTKGTIYWYGGDENGLDITTNSYLKANNKIFHWSLKKVQDIFGNNITYTYEKNTNTSASNLNGGLFYYLSKIFYTGHLNELGKYEIEFKRFETNKQTPNISFKYGIKKIDHQLLKEIIIKHNNKPINKHQFYYGSGRFNKDLLTKVVEFYNDSPNNTPNFLMINVNEFNYYDDVAANNGNLFFETQRVLIKPINTNSIVDLVDITNGSKINSNQVFDYGFNIRPAFGIELKFLKHSNRKDRTLTLGLPHNINFNQSRSIISLFDANGDGLDDIVFRTSNGLKFLPNTNLFDDSSVTSSFGVPLSFFVSDEKDITGISDISKSKGKYFTPLLSSFDLNFKKYHFSTRATKTFSNTNVYYQDSNNDGVTDIIKDGLVYFGKLNENGNVSYSTSSVNTENLIITANGTNPIVEINESEYESNLLLNYDAVKIWEAPKAGKIRIQDFVSISQSVSNNVIYSIEKINLEDRKNENNQSCRLHLIQLNNNNNS